MIIVTDLEMANCKMYWMKLYNTIEFCNEYFDVEKFVMKRVSIAEGSWVCEKVELSFLSCVVRVSHLTSFGAPLRNRQLLTEVKYDIIIHVGE